MSSLKKKPSTKQQQRPLVVDENDENEILCLFCSVKLSSSEILRKHILRVHLNYFPIKCAHDNCSVEFDDETLLEYHSKIVHDGVIRVCMVNIKHFTNIYLINLYKLFSFLLLYYKYFYIGSIEIVLI